MTKEIISLSRRRYLYKAVKLAAIGVVVPYLPKVDTTDSVLSRFEGVELYGAKGVHIDNHKDTDTIESIELI